MTCCPNSDENWETLSAREAGFDPARLTEAIAFAEAHESPWPRDLAKAGDVPGLSQFEKPPWNEALSPLTVPGDYFASAHNRTITWRRLLNQTSEWEGTLWDKPDRVDSSRQVGPGSDNSRKGERRDLQPPGTFWEYNVCGSTFWRYLCFTPSASPCRRS
jgi:hypothetical protein